jgi:hypothetical protein
MDMKAIFSVVLVLGLCGLIRAAEEKKVDPVGTWKLEYMIGDQSRTATLVIVKEGEKLAGTMNWADQKDEKLKDVKVKDGELTFSAERKVGDNSFHVEYKLAVDGDQLKGKGGVENGGRKTEFEIGGMRKRKGK